MHELTMLAQDLPRSPSDVASLLQQLEEGMSKALNDDNLTDLECKGEELLVELSRDATSPEATEDFR